MSTGYNPNPNPYQPPSAPTQNQWAQAQGPSEVSPAIIDSMRKTRPWVMLLAILGSISTGLMLLGGLGMLAAAGSRATNGLPAGVGFMYLVIAAIYVVPIVMMYRYSGAINRLMHGGGQQELEQAVDAQRSIWQTFGIMALIGIVGSVLMVVVAVGFAMGPMRF